MHKSNWAALALALMLAIVCKAQPAEAQEEYTPNIVGTYTYRCNQQYGSLFVIVQINFDTMTGVNLTRNEALSSVRYGGLFGRPTYGAGLVEARGYAGGEEYSLRLWFDIDPSGTPTLREFGTLETAESRRGRWPPDGAPRWAMTCRPYYG